jgi:tetratricopeptide (TPR) repeat protein
MKEDISPEKKEAIEEKDKGNECYKKKDFEGAIAHYKKAMELDPDNMAYQTNLAGLCEPSHSNPLYWY